MLLCRYLSVFSLLFSSVSEGDGVPPWSSVRDGDGDQTTSTSTSGLLLLPLSGSLASVLPLGWSPARWSPGGGPSVTESTTTASGLNGLLLFVGGGSSVSIIGLGGSTFRGNSKIMK